MTTTPRLRELEEELQKHEAWMVGRLSGDSNVRKQWQNVHKSLKGRIKGYKLALEDLRPVLEAAHHVIASWAAENIGGVDKGHTGDSDLRALRHFLKDIQ